MQESSKQYIEYLKKLKINELKNILNDYNVICNIYKYENVEYNNLKKDKLITLIDSIKNNYVKGIISLLCNNDFDKLKIILKKNSIDILNENRELINYLNSKHIIWINDVIEVPSDLHLKNIVKNKIVSKQVKDNSYLYNLIDGIIIAYGVIDIKYLNTILSIDDYLIKIKFNYKKEYDILDNMLVSKKLTNKKKIDKYFKNNNYKEFTIKEFSYLGNNEYHRHIKSYKKFIKMLKNYFVFSNRDIEFVDKNIVIPYLYNSINEENIAYKNLEETISLLFEFKGNKLKDKMLKEIVNIRNYFPLWELRGYRKEDKNE